MILQALYEYYQRNKEQLPPKGFQIQEIKFVIQIDKNGKFLNLLDKREGKKGTRFLLPKAIDRTGVNAWRITNLLWDHYGYVLMHSKDNTDAARNMAQKQQKTFRDKIQNMPSEVQKDEGVNAVISFYNSNEWLAVKKHPVWQDCAKIPGCNLSFQLNSDECLVPQREIVKKHQASIADNIDEDENDDDVSEQDIKGNIVARCLITGDIGAVARKHTPTPISGSKSNARIVGIQKNSGFDSYNKQQAFNAPVSNDAEFAYSTALKHLIKSESNKILISDMTIVFWAQKNERDCNQQYDFESNFGWYFKSEKDDPDKNIKAVHGLYKAIETGSLPANEGNRFYVLGLAPNAARISVRFWKTGTIKEFADKIKQHFDDFNIIHHPNDPEYLSLYQILSATVLDYKMENVPPNLAGAVISSVLDGKQYPQTLLQQCIRRIRAEQHVTRARAAILKAYVNRFNRIHHPGQKEVPVSLDVANKDVGYLLGRLFAVLEKVQIQSAGGEGRLNSTIRDRFYGAFSSSPMTVMPLLLKLKNHHIAKLENGKIWFEGLVGEIMDNLNTQKIPAHLTLEQQAHFAIGYYHQRQSFFIKK